MKKKTVRLSLNREIVRVVGQIELSLAKGGLVEDDSVLSCPLAGGPCVLNVAPRK